MSVRVRGVALAGDRITTVPGVFREADFLDRVRLGEGCQRRSHGSFCRAIYRTALSVFRNRALLRTTNAILRIRTAVAILTDQDSRTSFPDKGASEPSRQQKTAVSSSDSSRSRTQPPLPMKQGRASTITHDYKRHGTTTLFAADVLEGKLSVIVCSATAIRISSASDAAAMTCSIPLEKMLAMLAYGQNGEALPKALKIDPHRRSIWQASKGRSLQSRLIFAVQP